MRVGKRPDERRSAVFGSAAIEQQVIIARTNTDARSIHMTGYIFIYIFAHRWAAYERLDSFLPLLDEVKIEYTVHCNCMLVSFFFPLCCIHHIVLGLRRHANPSDIGCGQLKLIVAAFF